MRRASPSYLKSKLLHAYLRLASQPARHLYALPGHLHPLEGRFLYWLAQRVPENGRAVEIGSYKGKSSSFIASGLRRGARLTCVDPWLNETMPEGPADVLPDFLANTRDYAERIDVCRASSVAAASKWSGPIDLLFIDGDHSYAACRADIEAWAPFVSRRGWIAFHDTGQDSVAAAIRDVAPPLEYGTRLQAWSLLAGRVARESRT